MIQPVLALSIFPRKDYWWSVLLWTALVAPAQASLQCSWTGCESGKVGSSTVRDWYR